MGKLTQQTNTKILIVGPAKSGKTTIANCLAEATDRPSDEYHPTVGVRILEFDIDDVIIGGALRAGNSSKTLRAEVQLWDCSGDHKYENSWPAMARGMSGVIFVCNAEEDREHNKDLQTWFAYFCEQQSLEEGQAIVFAYNANSERQPSRTPKLSGGLSQLPVVKVSLADDEALRSEFKAFLGTVLGAIQTKRQRDEDVILKTS